MTSVLLPQGMAESRELEDFDGQKYSYCLVSRRCRLHTGPRYKARGLNEYADPGNEIECDQVVWKHAQGANKPLAWSRWVAKVELTPPTASSNIAENTICMASCGKHGYQWEVAGAEEITAQAGK